MASSGNVFKISGISPDTGTITNDGITSATSLTISGSNATNGQTVEVYIDGKDSTHFAGDATLASHNSSAWTFNYNFSSLGDGTHTIYAYDMGSNSWATYTVTIDTKADAAPKLTITTDANSDGWINASEQGVATTDSIKVAFGTDAKAGDIVKLTSNTGTSTTYTLTSTDITNGYWNTTVTKPVAGGTLTVSATLTDVAGNVSAAGTASATLDVTAPAAPTVALANDTGTSSTDHITKDGSLSVTGIESGATVQYSTNGGSTWSSSFTATEGVNTVLVRQTDAAGNIGTSSSLTFTLDTTAPSAPTVALSSDTGSSGSDKITKIGTLAVTGLESGATVQYSTDGGQTWSGSFTAAEGVNNVQVRQTDAAGNAGTAASFSFTLDTTAPTAPTVALSNDTGASHSDGITNDGTLVVTGTESGAKVEYSTDGGNSWSTGFTAAEGVNNVLVRQTDVAGNASATSSLSFTLDTQGPAAPTVALANDTGASNGDGITSNGALNVTGLENGAAVQYSVDGGTTWNDSFTAKEGVNTVLVRQTDVAGNAGASSSFSFTLDTTAPDAPTVALTSDTGASGSDHVTSNGALMIGGLESGAKVEYSTDNGNSWSSSFTATEGANSVLVRQTDVAGNVGSAASFSFTLDTTAPDAPTVALAVDSGSSGSDGITNNGTLNVTGLENGAAVQYSTDNGTTWTDGFAAKEGENTVLVRQIDIAGNKGASASFSFTLDTTAPTAPTVALADDTGSSGNDGITKNGTLTVDGTESGAKVEYSTDGGNTWTTGFTAQEGENNVLVRQTDVAGNVSTSSSIKFTLDTTAPDAPTVALSNDSGASHSDGITNDGTLNVAGLENGAAVQYSTDGGTTWSGSFSAHEGVNTVLVHQTDVAGNVSNNTSLTFTLDTTAPDAPTVALSNDTGASHGDGITNDGTLTITGTESGATVQYSTDNGATWTSSFTAQEGSNSVQVRQVDVAGNAGSATTFAFTLDTTAPDAPTVALASDTGSSSSDGITNNGTLTIGSVESGATVEYSTDGGKTWSSSFTAAEGVNDVLVRQTDVAGNTSGTSSLSFTLDTVAPDAPVVALANDSGASASDHVTNVGTLNVTGLESGAKVEYSVDGGQTWSGSFTAAEGVNSVQVRQTDAAGNAGAATSFSFTLDTTAPTAPTVALSNDSGTSHSDGITNDGTLNVAGLENGAAVQYSIDNGTTWTNSFSAAQGVNNVLVRQVDVAGNASAASSLSFTLDNTAPAAPVIALTTDSGVSGTDHITNNGALTITGLESGATVEYSADGGKTWTNSFSATEGANTVMVRQTDVAGNTGTSASFSFTLDTTAPNAPTVALAVDSGSSNTDHITNNGTLVVTGIENGANVQYSVDGGKTWTSGFTATEGVNNVLVHQTDVAGNVSAASSFNFTLDTKAAAPTFGSAQLNGSSSTMTVGGGAEANSVVTITDLTTGKVAGTATANGSGAWTFTTGKVSGIHTFGISVVDAAGNTAKTTAEAIIGTMGNDTIKDVAGQDDILSGAQGIDTFVFGAGFGHDVITDFIAGNGTHEVIQFSKSSFSGYTDLMAHAQQSGANVVIADAAGDTLTLVGINIADLKSVDFAFV